MEARMLHYGLDKPFCYFKFIALGLAAGVSVYKITKLLIKRQRQAKLRGKVVVITGASSGIGEALAHSFYRRGCQVVLSARREGELNRVKDNLISSHVDIPTKEPVVIRLDMAELDNMKEFLEKVYKACGTIDILINNAGVSHRGAAINTEPEVDKQIMFINYFGPVFLTKAALPKMIKDRSGQIIFVSSVQGRIAIPDRSAYAASKHAMQAFGDSLRAEMKQYNINVAVVSPGYVKTAISLNALTGSGENRHGIMDKATAAGFTAEYTAEEILDMIANKEDELVISQFVPKVAIFLRYFWPSAYFRLMARRATKTS